MTPTPLIQVLRTHLSEVWIFIWIYSAAALFGYLVGAINPASIIARVRGMDLRLSGSGNPGATNAGRVMGWRIGVLVGFLDVLKGYLPVVMVNYVAGDGPARVAGVMAVVGHITSPYLRGRGGKGVATAMGAILAVRPLWALPVLLIFGIVVVLTRNVGLASVCGALGLIPAALVFRYDYVDLIFAVVLSGLICIRHSKNLSTIGRALRLREGIPPS